jgi:TPR repeat protein
MNSAFGTADLASLYETGRRGPPDIAKAFELYRRAATAGDRTRAIFTKLETASDGRGVRRNAEEAIRWYDRAARQRSNIPNVGPRQ